MHLPPPNLPRFGGGERPPFLCKPPAPLTITMGQRLTVFASPNTPRVLLSVYSCQPIRAPFPPSGKGVGGKGRCAAATLGAILCAVRIDFRLPSKINPYPAQPATGVLGQSPKRVLVPFTRVKGTPRRRAVQIRITKKLSPPKVSRNYHLNIPPEASRNHYLNPPPEAETSPQGMRRAGRPARPARGSSRPARRCRPGRRSRPGGPPGGRGCPVRCGVPDNPAG